MTQHIRYLVSSWLLLALQVKVGKVTSFMVKIFVVPVFNHENFAQQKLPAIQYTKTPES